MRRWPGRWVGAVLSVAATACAPRPLPPDALRAWVADSAHGLVQEVRLGPHTLTCRYRPVDLLVAQDLANAHQPLTTRAADSVRREYAGKAYFALELTGPGGEIENTLVNTPAAYSAAVQYLSTGIAADTYLTTSPRDSAAALTSMYLRQYGTTGRSTVALVFAAPPTPGTTDYHLTLLDRQFGLGRPRFRFAAADLRRIPPLATGD